MSDNNETVDETKERLDQALRKVELLADTFLEHLTDFDKRVDTACRQLEETMNARIEARVQEELAKLGYSPKAGDDSGGE